MSDLKGKSVILTGASSGIGAATAVHLASLGASVALYGRDKGNLEKTKKQCIQTGQKENQVLVVQGDVTKSDNLEKLVAETLKHFRKIDVLINCAGIVINGGAIGNSLENYDNVMNVNLRSVIHLTQLCSQHLIKTKGAIVNVSSLGGLCSVPTLTFYCISKAALDQFTKCLALEMAPFGVRVNSVNPGVIVTDILRRAGMTSDIYEKFLDISGPLHPLGRVGQVEEVAKAIAFLASNDSSFTTGELLRVDGGRALAIPADDFKG